MWQSFKNYFWTAQIIVGPVMGIKVATVGETPLELLLYFLYGFVLAMLVTAPFCLMRAAWNHRGQRRLPAQPDRSESNSEE